MPMWWRRRPEELDREVHALLGLQTRVPGPSESELGRSRMRVARELSTDGAASKPWRRLALASAGGGGLWAALAGSAAAHKAAAAAVGLSVLVGGTVAAETSGIGPAVREAVGIESHGDEQAGALDQQVGPPEDSNAAVQVTPAGDGAPGNLVGHLREDGSFSVRAVLTEAGEDEVTLDTPEGSRTIALAGGAALRVPGNPQATTEDLAEFEGALVFVQGQCDEGAEDLADESCAITSLQVLGNAGNPPKPEDAGKPEDIPGPAVTPGPQGLGNGNADGGGPPATPPGRP